MRMRWSLTTHQCFHSRFLMSQILWGILKCLFLVPAEEIEEVWWSAVYVAESTQKSIAVLVVGAEQRLYAFIGVKARMQDITAKNVLAEDQLNDVVYEKWLVPPNSLCCQWHISVCSALGQFCLIISQDKSVRWSVFALRLIRWRIVSYPLAPN